MDLRSLPRFPPAATPDSPPSPQPDAAKEDEPFPPGGGWTMFFQLLFLVLFWTGIYILHQQALAFSIAAERARAKEEAERERREYAAFLAGKWQSTQWEGLILEISCDRFTITRQDERVLSGEYSRTDSSLRFAIWSSTGYSGFWSVQYRVTTEELVIWGATSPIIEDNEFAWVVFVRMFGRDAARQPPHELRLKRMSG